MDWTESELEQKIIADRVVMLLYREGHETVELTIPQVDAMAFLHRLREPVLEPDPRGFIPNAEITSLRLWIDAKSYEMRLAPKES